MKIFNIGALEFLFILLLALIVLGPRKAIKTAGDIGRWLKTVMQSQFWQDLVSTSREIQDLPRKVMDDEEIKKTIEELDRSEKFIHQSIGKEHSDVQDEEWEESHPHIHPDV